MRLFMIIELGNAWPYKDRTYFRSPASACLPVMTLFLKSSRAWKMIQDGCLICFCIVQYFILQMRYTDWRCVNTQFLFGFLSETLNCHRWIHNKRATSFVAPVLIARQNDIFSREISFIFITLGIFAFRWKILPIESGLKASSQFF